MRKFWRKNEGEKEENFAHAKRAPIQQGRRETRDGRGEVRVGEGLPPCPSLIYKSVFRGR